MTRYRVSWFVAPDGSRGERVVSAPSPAEAIQKVEWDRLLEGKESYDMKAEEVK